MTTTIKLCTSSIIRTIDNPSSSMTMYETIVVAAMQGLLSNPNYLKHEIATTAKYHAEKICATLGYTLKYTLIHGTEPGFASNDLNEIEGYFRLHNIKRKQNALPPDSTNTEYEDVQLEHGDKPFGHLRIRNHYGYKE